MNVHVHEYEKEEPCFQILVSCYKYEIYDETELSLSLISYLKALCFDDHIIDALLPYAELL